MSHVRINVIAVSAGVAQIVGTIVALAAAIYLVGQLLHQQLASTNLTLLWVIGAPPFPVAIVFGVQLLSLGLRGATENKVRAWIKGVLFADAVLLLIVVYATGGVEGNIFSPIFFLIPVCSVALLKHWQDEKRTITALVVVTIVCHLASALLHKVYPIAKSLECAPFATWIILYVCVALAAWTSVQNFNYANLDASLEVSQE